MIKLSSLEKEDLIKIVEWNINKSADSLLQWAGPAYTYPLTLGQVEDYFLNDVKKDKSNIFVYKILLTETDEMIGTVELREIDESNKIGRVCRFLIGEEMFRGKGIGILSFNEVLRMGFQDLGFKKITLGVFDFNLRAIRCYKNAGFITEKIIENARKATNGYWNLCEMSISKVEWRKKNECSKELLGENI